MMSHTELPAERQRPPPTFELMWRPCCNAPADMAVKPPLPSLGSQELPDAARHPSHAREGDPPAHRRGDDGNGQGRRAQLRRRLYGPGPARTGVGDDPGRAPVLRALLPLARAGELRHRRRDRGAGAARARRGRPRPLVSERLPASRRAGGVRARRRREPAYRGEVRLSVPRLDLRLPGTPRWRAGPRELRGARPRRAPSRRTAGRRARRDAVVGARSLHPARPRFLPRGASRRSWPRTGSAATCITRGARSRGG